MTLEQMRTALLGRGLRDPHTPEVCIDDVTTATARALHEIATRRKHGERIALPREHMPVLP
jgi:hypothetical protein